MNVPVPTNINLRALQIMIIIAVGTILLGIFKILIPQWAYIPHMVKPAVFGITTLFFYILAYCCDRKKIIWPVEGLRLIGTVIFGIGIFVFAELYDVDILFPHGFIFITLAATSIALMYRYKPHACISLGALLLWATLSQSVYDYKWTALTPALILILTLLYTWRIKSSQLLAVCTCVFFLSVTFPILIHFEDDFNKYILYFIYGSVLVIHAEVLFLERFESCKPLLNLTSILGSIFLGATFLIETQKVGYDSLFNTPITFPKPFEYIIWISLTTLAIFFVIFLFLALYHRKTKISTYTWIQFFMLPGLLILIYLLFSCNAAGLFHAQINSVSVNPIKIFINILFLLSMLYHMFEGIQRAHDVRIVGSIVMILIWILCHAVFNYPAILSNGIVFFIFGIGLMCSILIGIIFKIRVTS